MALGTRAISRLPAATGSGISGAKKIADLYVSSNTNSAGDISDPAVYDYVINNVLAPFSGTIDGQNAIADYTNKRKALAAKQTSIESSKAGLQLSEYNAWYMDEDDDESATFRNPSYVLNATSESLDILVAQTLSTLAEQEQRGESTAETSTYLRDLTRRADRMRTLSEAANDGVEGSIDGYGYFVDADPNTGHIRGASLMPTDADFADLSAGKVRTDSYITVGNKRVPLYLTAVKGEDGTMKASFGGVEYSGDEKMISGGVTDVVLGDRQAYQSGPGIERGKLYKTFTGRANIDGSPKEQYYYIGFDNKPYSFTDDDPKGKALLSSLQSVGAFSDTKSIPRISPTAMQGYAVAPLPEDGANFAGRQATHTMNHNFAAEAQAESDALNSRGAAGMLAGEWDAAMARKREDPYANIKGVAEGAKNLVEGAASGIASFFGRKNRVPAPASPAASRGGVYNAPDVLESGRSFFEGR